jgi:FkbM family methyltransferase
MTAHLKTPLQWALFAMSGWQGVFAASCRRKLLRRLSKQSAVAFAHRLSALTTQDVVLDLGANVGKFTEIFAQTGAQVHAYEPDPYCFALLQKRFEGRENVHLHNQAVGAKSGLLPLRRAADFNKSPDAYSQMSSIVFATKDYQGGDVIEVEVVAYGDVLRSFDRKVAIVKMDIEGAEFEILDLILKQPEAYAVNAMFIETHERHAPNRIGMVKAIRQANWQGQYPFLLDTFWL